MKKLLLPALLLASILPAGKIQAQSTLIIGAGAQSGVGANSATGDPGPMYRSSSTNNFVYSKHHYLYTLAELAGLPSGALITEVAWYKTTAVTSNTDFTFQVYMKNSALTAVPAPPQNWTTLTASSTQVYNSSNTSLSSAIGWVPIALTAPFTYTGTGLEISVNFDISNGVSPWTSAGISWQKDPINNRTISYVGATSSTILSNARTVRPRLRITYISNPCTSPPTPGSITLTPATAVCPGTPVKMELTGNSVGLGQTYQLQSGTSSTGPFTNVGSSSVLVYPVTINPTATIYYRVAITCGSSTVYTPAAQVVVTPSLPGGTYTIDNTQPTAGTNYNSFNAAIAAMKCGITGPVTFNVASGSYNEQVIIPVISGTSAANTVTFKSASGNAGDVDVNFAATGTANNYIFRLDDASYINFKNLTFKANGATYARAVQLNGLASRDSFVNCIFTGPLVTSTSSNLALLFADPLDGGNNVFIGNTFNNGSTGCYYSGNSTSVLTANGVFIGNTYINQYAYANYFYYTDNLKFNYNTISTASPYTGFIGIRSYYGDGGIEIRNNNISGIPGGGYGIYQYYSDATATNKGLVANNVISIGSGTSTVMGIRNYYSNYQRFYNNSVNINSTDPDCYAGYFYYSSTSYQNNEIRNNVFSNSGGGFALYVYNPTATYNNSWDYNNLYTTGSKLVKRGTPAADFSTLTEWRQGSEQELNSISYNPGFVSATDLHPDPAKPETWSLNGRGIHMAGNNTDADGNPRVVSLADGVPDIGAYEFTPVSVPPTAQASPAVPAAGTQQVFTFGEDTVAVIDWKANAVVPNYIDVKQYTGTLPPALALPGRMYFYTDINTQNITYNYDVAVYYKDPWRGTTGAENTLRLLKKSGAKWHAYNGNESSPNVTRNLLFANSLTTTGLYTGAEDGKVLSATIKPATTTVMCPGGSLILHANTAPGYTYQWKLNGANIPGATTSSYTATTIGDYTVDVTDVANNITVTSDAVSITIIAAPSAQVTASGALTYCIGSSLSLNTPVAQGLSYQWYLNGNLVPGATSANYAVNATGSYAVMVSNIACGTLSPLTIVAAGPLALNIGNDTTFCEQKNKPFILNAGHTGAQYTWSTGANSQQITVNNSAKYWVEVNAGPGCMARDTIQVQIDPLPTVNSISYSRTGNTYHFSPGGESNVTGYLWIFNDGATSTDKNTQHVFTIAATEVKLIVSNDCGKDTIALQLPLDVKDVSGSNSAVSLYPNPATDVLTVKAEGDFFIQYISVVNQVGQVVYKKALQDRVKTDKIDVSNLPAGYYILQAATTGGAVARPFNIIR